jgi:hypothetical protein
VDVEDEPAVVVYPPGRQPRPGSAPPRPPGSRPEGTKRFRWLIIGGAAAFVAAVVPIVLVLALKSPSPAPDQSRFPPEAWREYVSQPGNYRVLMPGVPQLRPGVGFIVVGFDLPTGEGFILGHGNFTKREAEMMPVEQRFARARDSMLAKFAGSRLLDEKPVTFEGHPGLQWEVEVPGKGNMVARFYAARAGDGYRFYLLTVGGPGYRADSADVRKFFDSFQLLKRPGDGDPKQVEPPEKDKHKDKQPPPDKEKKGGPDEKGRQYFEHTHDVPALAVRDGGKALFTATEDGEVARWDVAPPRKVRSTRVVAKSGGFGALAVPAGGTTVAVTAGQGLVRLLDLEGGKAEIDLQPEKLGGYNQIAAAYSPDGRLLATGYGQEVKVWDVNGRKQLFELKGHKVYILSLAFSPDGRTLAVGCGDQTIKLWDAEKGKEKGSLVGHKPPETPFDGYRTMQWTIRSLAFSPDGALLASASNDKSVIVWDMAKKQNVKVLPHHECVLAVAFARDGKRLASGTSDGKVYLWETANWQERRRLDMDRNAAVRALAFLPDGERLMVAAGRDVILQPLGKE